MTSEQPQLLSVRSKTTSLHERNSTDSAAANQPQYSRTQSLQSSAANLSDYASDASSEISKTSYETPPSRVSTPVTQQAQINSEMTLPARPGVVQPSALDVRSGQRRQNVRTLTSLDEMSPPTPGVDDTPYIRFAIDQLTADEDVMGHGRHGSLLSNEHNTFAGPVPEEEEEEAALPSAMAARGPSREAESPATAQRRISRKPVPDERLLAIHPPDGQRWADLGYVPIPLRISSLVVYLLLCLLMIAALLFSNIYALRGHGLYDYDGNATPRYFIFQYLPQLLGMILILWLFVVEAAIYRAVPYFSMSSAEWHDRLLQGFRITPANFLLPDLTWFRNGEPLLGVTFLIFWITNFTIPLLSALYQTKWITNDGPDRFRWTTVQGVGWMLVALYLFLVAAVCYCMTRFRSSRSTLMWDPTSLSDLVALFQRSNLFRDFERSEVSHDVDSELPPRILRLGYWTTTQQPEIFYGVGEENSPLNRLSTDMMPLHEKGGDSSDSSFDVEGRRYSYASSFTRNIHSPFVRYRWVPWYLRDSAVVAWIIVAALLLIAFLVVSFVNNAVQGGFRPLLPSITRSGGFSSSNFLYSFLPTLLGMILFLVWQPIDVFFRQAQPFANLSSPTGASAERSLLVSYVAGLPGLVSLQALVNRDFKVAYISFIGLISLAIPVLAGGVFTAVLFRANGQVRMIASMPGYYALCVFVAIYAVSFAVIWPKRKRYLPHGTSTIADLMSFLYASPLMSEPGMRNINSEPELVARLVGAPAGLTGDGRGKRPSTKYAFGVYIGRDGKEHLGIDRLQRPGSGEMLVTAPFQK